MTDEQKDERKKMVSNLMIDCILRRGEYARFYNDIETAKQDYLEAIEICKEFIVGNERTLGSAYF